METTKSATAQAMEDARQSVDQGNENGFLKAIKKLIPVGKGAAIRGLYYAEVRPFFKCAQPNSDRVKKTLRLFVGDGKSISFEELRAALQMYDAPVEKASDISTAMKAMSDFGFWGDIPIAALICALEAKNKAEAATTAKDDAPSDEAPNTDGNSQPTED